MQQYRVPSIKPVPLQVKLIASYQFATAAFGAYSLFWIFQQRNAGALLPATNTGFDLLRHWVQTGHWLMWFVVGVLALTSLVHAILGLGLLKKYPLARTATIWWDWTLISLGGVGIMLSDWFFWIDAIVIAISYAIIYYLNQPETIEIFQPEAH